MNMKILFTILNIPRALLILPVYKLLPSNIKRTVKADIDRYSYMTGSLKVYSIRLIFLLVNNRAFRNIYQRRIPRGGAVLDTAMV